MCMRDRPTLVTKQIGISSVVVVGRYYSISSSSPLAATPAPPTSSPSHREIGRVDLGDDLRQHVALLPDQRVGDPAQCRAPGRPDRRGVALQCTGDRVEELQPRGVDPPSVHVYMSTYTTCTPSTRVHVYTCTRATTLYFRATTLVCLIITHRSSPKRVTIAIELPLYH